MFNILFILQICAMVLSFVSVLLLSLQKSTTATKLMLITCICAFVQNCGYMLEMTSKDVDQAMIAIKIEYLGGAYILSMLMIFVFHYCRVRLLNWVKLVVLILDSVVLVSVWCCEYIPLYYTNVSFINTGIMPHVVIDKGPLYIVFSAVMYFEFIACAVVSLISFSRSTDSNMKKNYWLLFLTSAIPCMFYIGGVIGLVDGYDSAPIGGAAGIIVFGFAIIIRRLFDVVETAHENILMNLEDAIIILDYRRGFQEANKAAIALFPELATTPYGQMVASSAFNELFEAKPEDDVKIDGRYYKVHINEIYATGGVSNNFIGYSIVLFDNTETKEQISKMDELRVAADSANRAKSSFLANVSHEIRTPINAVVGLSDVILRDYDEPQLLSYANSIQIAANTLLDLINDILDFSKIESGRVDLKCANYNTDDFFREIINVFNHKKNEKGLNFISDIDGNFPRVLYGDVLRLKQIATNILANAFKYTSEGSVTLRARFEKLDDEHGNIIISVEDTGIGIRKDEIDSVFDMFVRLDERINRSIEGTGLGLNITKKLVDIMDGEIKVYSEYGKGSVFTIIIPQGIKSLPNDVIGNLDFKEPVAKRSGVGYEAPEAKVLIVDDVKTNLIVAKALLRDTKVKITTATSGMECLDLVKNEHFDVIFLDHRMPVMDGVETLHNMMNSQHMCKDTPVIMLTANAVSSAREFYIKEGFSDFITKPVSEEKMTGILKEYLPKNLIREY